MAEGEVWTPLEEAEAESDNDDDEGDEDMLGSYLIARGPSLVVESGRRLAMDMTECLLQEKEWKEGQA